MNIELKGLKGLRDLLSESNVGESQVHLVKISVNDLVPSKYQPRVVFDNHSLEELSASIKINGVIQPIIVRALDSRYEIIAGERRWRAAKLAGLTHVPGIIHRMEDKIALGFAIVENIQREKLNPLEEAEAFAKLQEEFSMNHQEIANLIGKSRATVTNTLRLLNLNDDVKELLQSSKIDMGHARALLKLSADQQSIFANQIKESSLSVRTAEKMVRHFKKIANKTPPTNPSSLSLVKSIDKLTSLISKKINLVIQFNLNNQGQGQIIINIESKQDLEEMLKALT